MSAVCDRCGVNPAAIHLTQIEGTQSRTRDLCEPCAVELGLSPGTPLATAPLTDFLAKMGQGASVGDAPATGACPGCGLSLADFKRTGRLGCARCWGTFEASVRGLLRKLHGATQHAGKAYVPAGTSPDRPQRMAALRRALQMAVDGEDFERAAALRDQIRRLEGQG